MLHLIQANIREGEPGPASLVPGVRPVLVILPRAARVPLAADDRGRDIAPVKQKWKHVDRLIRIPAWTRRNAAAATTAIRSARAATVV
jgi:hypothetical protein